MKKDRMRGTVLTTNQRSMHSLAERSKLISSSRDSEMTSQRCAVCGGTFAWMLYSAITSDVVHTLLLLLLLPLLVGLLSEPGAPTDLRGFAAAAAILRTGAGTDEARLALLLAFCCSFSVYTEIRK